MTNVVSAKKRRANRRNAKKSTGPRSAAAKRRSSQNAIKHGLLAHDVVVPSIAGREQQADFDALLADLHRALRPKNRIEQTLVERIAACDWRLRRVHRFEAGQMHKALESAEEVTSLAHDARVQFDEGMREFAYEQATLELLGRTPDQLSPAELDQLDERVTVLAKFHKLLNADAAPEALKDRLRAELPRLLREREAHMQRVRADLDAAERESAQRREKAALLASLPESEALTRIVRYENMLDRQLHRSLAELRRRQEKRPAHRRHSDTRFPPSRRRRKS